ncbi:restriction endonuclease, partial [Escherichia coli]|nr:restriction endonuclease [Escherichia coli]
DKWAIRTTAMIASELG